jgi:hypothetical protein
MCPFPAARASDRHSPAGPHLSGILNSRPTRRVPSTQSHENYASIGTALSGSLLNKYIPVLNSIRLVSETFCKGRLSKTLLGFRHRRPRYLMAVIRPTSFA